MERASARTKATQAGVSAARRLAVVDLRLRRALGDLARRQAARGVSVFLFGSAAKAWPSAPVGADFDLGYELGAAALNREALRRELQRAVEDLPTVRPVDLVDFSEVSEVFRREAMKSAINLTDEHHCQPAS